MSHATEQAKAHKARAFVDDKLNSHKVIVFSKTTQCPFSALVKKALKHYNIKDLNIIELDHRDDADEIYTYLSELTGSGNLPRVFVNKKFIGDGKDIELLHEQGDLKQILEENKAI